MCPGDPDSVPLFGYEWVDDHILVEPDIESRQVVAEDTLHLSIITILGPEATNERKFTHWSPRTRALGHDW